MNMPEHLETAIEALISKNKLNHLYGSYQALSGRYRGVRQDSKGLIGSDAERTAYLAARFPATYGAIIRVFQELQTVVPNVQVNDLLDVGSGPGTALWAAAQVFLGIKKFSLLERDAGLIQIGKTLICEAQPELASMVEWIQGDVKSKTILQHDLVCCSYMINELKKEERAPVVEKLWHATKQFFVVIEPGTPQGFQNILWIRERLLQLAGHIVAPCPDCKSCPMQGNDWCHFSQRIPRTRFHREIKSGALNYEDEKFSYIIFSKEPVPQVQKRVLRHPVKNPGHVKLTLCTQDGWKQETISKKQKEVYKYSRDIEWGDGFNF